MFEYEPEKEINNKNIILKTSNKINYYFDKTFLKMYDEYRKKDIYYLYLSNEYELLSFEYYAKMIKKTVGNYEKNKYYSDKLKIENNTILIDDYIMYPVVKNYKFQVLSSNLFDWYSILAYIEEGSKYTIIQCIGPWEISNDKLNLYFELENLLIEKKKCKVSTIFILFDYGENIKYSDIVLHYNNDTSYHIIDANKIDKIYDIKIYNVIINDIKLYDTKKCQNELATFPIYLYIVNYVLSNMLVNGNLFMNFNEIKLSKPFVQLLYIISNNFTKTQIIMKKINQHKYGTFKFNKLKTYNNQFDNLLKEYSVIDKYLGQNTLIKIDEPKYCDNLKENIRKPNIDIIIKSIYSKKMDINFVNFLLNSYEYQKHIFTRITEKIDYIIKNKPDINSIIANNINKCISFCKKYDIEINELYKDFKILNYDKIVKLYFENTLNKNIKLSLDSIYSITKPETTEKMCELIKTHFSKVKYIIDGNANVGSTTIIFSKHFDKVYSVEYDKTTYDILKHNVKEYDLRNVETYNDDIIDFIKNKKFNITDHCLFLDPPWTGTFYKLETNLDLYLSDINIIKIMKDTYIKYICIKTPHNYNFTELYKNFYNVVIYRLSGFYFIMIKK